MLHGRMGANDKQLQMLQFLIWWGHTKKTKQNETKWSFSSPIPKWACLACQASQTCQPVGHSRSLSFWVQTVTTATNLQFSKRFQKQQTEFIKIEGGQTHSFTGESLLHCRAGRQWPLARGSWKPSGRMFKWFTELCPSDSISKSTCL